MDEAHKLRNIYKNDGAKTAKKLSGALSGRKKVLLSATPLQNSILELYGLISVIDPHFSATLLRSRPVIPDRILTMQNWHY